MSPGTGTTLSGPHINDELTQRNMSEDRLPTLGATDVRRCAEKFPPPWPSGPQYGARVD